MNMGTQFTKQGKYAHLKTLDEVVDAYLELMAAYPDVFGTAEADHDRVLEFCLDSPSLAECVKRAVAGRRRDGKMFSEGSCIRASSREEFMERLLKLEALITFFLAETFEEIYDVVRANAPYGIGDLTCYNTSNRIALYRAISLKDYLYIHAGPRQGWRRLMGRDLRTEKGEPYRVPWAAVPQPLKRLTPHRVEDLLCEFRDLLHPGLLEPKREALGGPLSEREETPHEEAWGR